MIDDEHTSCTANGAGCADRCLDVPYRHIQDLRVGHADNLNIAEFAEGPRRVVVGTPLRIIGAPVLVIEQHVRDPAVGLIHADEIGIRGKLDKLR